MTTQVLIAHILTVMGIIVACYLSYWIGLYVGLEKEKRLNDEVNSIGSEI